MAFQHVKQSHHNGCFTACLAMVIGKSYEETFKMLYPNADPNDIDPPGLKSNHIAEAAAELLRKFGCKVRAAKARKLRSLRLARKHALLIIRWRWGRCGEVTEDNPWLCHAVIFDADTNEFLDPSTRRVVRSESDYEAQLDSVFYIEPPPRRNDDAEGRDEQRDCRTASDLARARAGSVEALRVSSASSAW